MKRISSSIIALLVAGTFSGPAAAQTNGFALDRFDPAERGSDWFAGDSLDLRGHGRPAVGLVGSWAYKPLVAYAADGSERTTLVKHQVITHLGGSVVLWERLRLGLNLPVVLSSVGNDAVVNGVRYNAPDGGGVGDLRLSADVRLFGVYGDPFTVALGAALFAPTGSTEIFAGDERVRVQPRLLVAGDAGPFAYSAKLGFTYRGLDETFAGTRVGSELQFAAAAGLRVADRKLVIGPEVFGSTVVSGNNSAFKTGTTPFELIIGGHYLYKEVRFGLGAGPGLTRGYGAPAVRVLASLEWVLSAEQPAPPPPSDRDNDGIIDEKDACPDEPGVPSSDPAKNGCPLPPPKPSDRDGDGIVDSKDACPDVAGVANDDPKKNGCPPDRDGDGIVDDKDACPDVPGVASDDPKKNGCPPPPADSDGDGIVDPEDACPNAPGKPNPDPKKNGCPAAVVDAGQIKILEQVKFKTGSALILPESDAILEAVAKVLTDHPEIKRIRIEGHTDDRGTPAINGPLSRDRAKSVLEWLAKHGIDRSRMTSEGYGQDRPIDTNSTDEGRRNNRRVEFHIVEPAK